VSGATKRRKAIRAAVAAEVEAMRTEAASIFDVVPIAPAKRLARNPARVRAYSLFVALAAREDVEPDEEERDRAARRAMAGLVTAVQRLGNVVTS